MIPVADWNLPAPRLVTGAAKLDDLDEISLDGNDNVLMGRIAVSYGHGVAWPLHLERYWNATVRKFHELFDEAASVAGVTISSRSALNLRSLETYWEFRVNDPLNWLSEIEPVLQSLGLSSEARNYAYPDGFSAKSSNGNSRSIVVRIRSGLRLRVYAKTNRRVRFEVEHDFVENARPLQGRHTDTDVAALFDWTSLAAEDATHVVNSALARLERAQVREGSQMSVPQLVIRISQALNDPLRAETMLTLLAANQSLVSTSGSDLTPSIRKLVSRSILEPVRPGARSYVLTPEFRSAGERLRLYSSNAADAPDLGAPIPS